VRCRHENADHLMPGEWYWPIDEDRCEAEARIVHIEQLRCLDCGAWLALGPSNDAPPEVAVEIRAAELAAPYLESGARPGADRFDCCPTNKSDELCDLCQAHVLAHAIATHDTEEG